MPNFYDRIREASARFGERVAIETSGPDGLSTVTYAELARRSAHVGIWLQETAQIARGDRVAILSANDARWVAAYLGILRVGGVAVPLDTAYSAAQVATVLADCGARVLFVSDRLEPTGLAASVPPLLAAPRVVRLSMPLDEHRPDVPVVAMEDDEMAAILTATSKLSAPRPSP
jgi:acyl-CoA synthetase (AMP-forming)/AMP-acid ligase II